MTSSELLIKNLSRYQRELDLTDYAMAMQCHVSADTIANIYAGAAIRLDTLDKIADGLNTTPAELLSDDND